MQILENNPNSSAENKVNMDSITHLISKKTKDGYKEEDFKKGYWLERDISGKARIERGSENILKYFFDLFVRSKHQGSILDIGAGAGNVVANFRRKGIDAYGCEYSSSGRKIAKKVFKIVLKKCDLREKLLYENDEFDWSLCIGVLSMIPIDYMKNALSEIIRVTKYGTLILVGTDVIFKPGMNPINQHHLTPLTTQKYWTLLNELGAKDWTSIQPPQRAYYGIGVRHEFAGLFSKNIWKFE